jgi:hypothetical protein
MSTDVSEGREINNLRCCNAGFQNPAYRLVRHKLFESKAVTV